MFMKSTPSVRYHKSNVVRETIFSDYWSCFGISWLYICWRLQTRHDVMDIDSAGATTSAPEPVSMATLDQTVPAAGEPGTECVLLGNGFSDRCVAAFDGNEVPTKYWYATLRQAWLRREKSLFSTS